MKLDGIGIQLEMIIHHDLIMMNRDGIHQTRGKKILTVTHGMMEIPTKRILFMDILKKKIPLGEALQQELELQIGLQKRSLKIKNLIGLSGL